MLSSGLLIQRWNYFLCEMFLTWPFIAWLQSVHHIANTSTMMCGRRALHIHTEMLCVIDLVGGGVERELCFK